MLNVNDTGPEFTLKNTEKEDISLSDYSDKIYHTGNPTRNIFKNISKPEDKYSSNKSIINVCCISVQIKNTIWFPELFKS